MNNEESIINLVLRKELTARNLPIRENATFRFGRKKHVIDFYINGYDIGIVTLNWKRTIPTNKLLQLEQLINSLKLKKLVLICNDISANARDFLARRNIPIQVVHMNEIIYNEIRIEDLIASY